MKRILNCLFLSVSLSLLLFFLSSCSLFKSEDEIIDEKVENLISLLENGDKEGLKSLFAESRIENISDFNNSLEELLEYYDGVLLSKSHSGTGTDRDIHGNYRATWYNLSYKITTSTEHYRMALYWCTEYSTNNKELGIWSLYIIKESDYHTPDSTYRGDGLWTPGINIGKVYLESNIQ